MNKNSNIYQILYAAIMVVLVGAVLALVYMSLKPRQDENIANDKRRQILAAVHIAPPTESETGATFDKYVTGGMLVDSLGAVVDTTRKAAFEVDMSKNVKQAQRQLPVFVCTLDDGSTKYVIPLYGAGLWGPIWGYAAVDDNGNTVYGTYFTHSGETPGLGARITEPEFQKQFDGKELHKEGAFKSIAVMKKGQKPLDGSDYVDAISGATITSRGVGDMLEQCIKYYEPFLKQLSNRSNQ
ncbi:MAG: NADH:ubiquinone reductase (Na(+)-transporting) subunit C [Muribaculaceae bacterium]|jgi:Na+-transporting NADH:ubiquinone oxidoreductase subunit C|nr:NADH:ubiquinone reductase (Na(+)-transporting) subunit C [Muribaculaceae bacterium]